MVWIVARTVIDVALLWLVCKGYQFGFWFLQDAARWHNTMVGIVGGSAVAAVVCYFCSLLKDFVFYVFKAGSIWSRCHPEDPPIKAIKMVTGNWRETFTVPVINRAVCGVLKEVRHMLKEQNVPGFLRCESKLFAKLESVAIKLFGYADECVLAWCYSHNDALLSECVGGLVQFVGNFPAMFLNIMPLVLLEFLARVGVMIGTVWYALTMHISINQLVPLLILARGILFVFEDAVWEEFSVHWVVRKYLAADSAAEGVQEFLSRLSGFEFLNDLLRRLGHDNESESSVVEESDESSVE